MSTRPKLTTSKVLNKSFIVWGKVYNERVKVFVKGEIDKEKYAQIQTLDEFVVVDYDHKKREWYVNYFDYSKVLSCTVDDISGTYSTTTF